MAARPADLVDALDNLIAHGMKDMPGAFPVGPAFGTDYLPMDPVEAMRQGTAHRCRSSSATTPMRAGCSPGSSGCCPRTSR